MTDGELFGLVCAAGAVGGLAHDLLAGGLRLPARHADADGNERWDPGTLGAIFLGALAAGLSWAFYGPVADVKIGGGTRPGEAVALTWGALAGAFLVGAAGGRWITAEVDKRMAEDQKSLFRRTASIAARAEPDPQMATRIAAATQGEDALALAQQMPVPTAVAAGGP